MLSGNPLSFGPAGVGLDGEREKVGECHFIESVSPQKVEYVLSCIFKKQSMVSEHDPKLEFQTSFSFISV